MEKKKLRLGDEGAAILTIQSTQSDPQKSIAELVENSIDAKSKNIKILRHRYSGKVEIVIEDDGEGVKPGQDGTPDMERIANEICKSYKKQLEEHLREGVQGEFAIGLLGFAAIGENLEMISRTFDCPKTKLLRLKANSLDYESGNSNNGLNSSGTKVRIWPVHDNIQPRLTAEKLNKYMGEELRERIRQSQVKIFIEDRIGRKVELEVKPQKYKGDKISQISKVNTPSGNIHFKLFITQQGDKGKVSIYRHGTKVIDDITEIQELNHEPWISGHLEGLIDSRFINIPPATRKGIVPDKQFAELVGAVKSLEDQLSYIIEKTLEKREQEMSKELIKSLRDAFQDIMQDLPSEYSWFNARGLSMTKPGSKSIDKERKPQPKIRLASGPLEYITITPKVSQIEPNERKRYYVRAWTPNDELIPIGVLYKWSIKPSDLCSIETKNDECYITAGIKKEDLKLCVTATLEKITIQECVDILILSESNKKSPGDFPIPKGVYMPSENWRSKWNESINTLEYNTGHNDYIQAEKKGKKYLLRYMGFLYAKQLVLQNFKTSGEESVMERMIEVIYRFENRI